MRRPKKKHPEKTQGAWTIPHPTIAAQPLLTRRLLLFPFLPFLLLLLLSGRLRLRLLVRGWRSRLRRSRRRALLLPLGRRRRLRPRNWLVPVRLGLTGCRTSGFGTVIRLR